MESDHEKKTNGETQEGDTPIMILTVKLDPVKGQISLESNVPDVLAKYGLWVSGLQALLQDQTLKALRSELQRQTIITPDQAAAHGLGILK